MNPINMAAVSSKKTKNMRLAAKVISPCRHIAAILLSLALVAPLAACGHEASPLSSRPQFEVSDTLYKPAPDMLKVEPTVREIVVLEGELEPTCELDSNAQNGHSFQYQGVIDFNGWRVTYYNPERMGITAYNLGINTVGSPIMNRGDGIGVYMNYIAVAMPVEYEYGAIVDTPFGTGIVVDHSQGAMDVVVFW